METYDCGNYIYRNACTDSTSVRTDKRGEKYLLQLTLVLVGRNVGDDWTETLGHGPVGPGWVR